MKKAIIQKKSTAFHWLFTLHFLWFLSFFSPLCTRSESPPFHFENRAQEAGLASFQHVLGSTEKLYLFDTMGSGVCAADINKDGYDDLYFLNAGRLNDPENPSPPRNSMFLNNQDGTFTDITDSSGLGSTGWGMSAVFADIDNDMDVDVYIGNMGKNQLFRNNGDNTFTEITEQAGVGDDRFAAGTVMADVDGDGWLDIFVTNYVEVSVGRIHAMGITRKYRGLDVMLGPLSFEPQEDVLYHNNGDGTFRDISQQAGIIHKGRGMGTVFSDFDNDGDPDLYVANDSTYNFLYENLGDSTFDEIGILTGAAVDRDGVEQGSMGVAAGDINQDGWTDLFVTAFAKECDVLYQNMGGLLFQDTTRQMRIAQSGCLRVGWGNALEDFNNDGFDDIVVAYGHIYPHIGTIRNEVGYAQKNSIFQNIAGKRFEDLTEQSGQGFQIEKVSRGLAVSDFDRNGKPDIAINNLEDSPTLLFNQSNTGNWLQVKVDIPNRSAVGSVVTVRAGHLKQKKELYAGGGYQSQNSQVLHFGLGNQPTADIDIRFPNGQTKRMNPIKANQRMMITPE